MHPLLDSYAATQLVLSIASHGPLLELDATLPPTNTAKTPLHVTVQGSSAPLMKAGRQQSMRKLSTEASCRKYLDAIATKLSSFYEFDYHSNRGPTIGDVLRAQRGSEGKDWKFRTAMKTHAKIGPEDFRTQIRKGQPLMNTRLPDIYTLFEWSKISQLNTSTNERIHDGALPALSDGRLYVIIPHSDFTREMIIFLKTIGVKAFLFNDPGSLVVKDEDALSEDEGSSLPGSS